MSDIQIISHNLAPVQYHVYLEAIKQTIDSLAKSKDQNDRYLYVTEKSISFDIDKIAEKVSLQFATSNNYPFEIRDGMSFATIHTLELDQKEAFSDHIKGLIIQELRKQLEVGIQAVSKGHTLASYATSLLTPLAKFSGQQAAGLSYPLGNDYEIQKKRLHVQPQKPASTPWLKAHKLTLTVQHVNSFDQQIIDSICSFLTQKNCDEEDIEEAREVLEEEAKKPLSNLSQLRDILVKESVARIYRDAKVRYLRYLYKGISEWKKKSAGKEEKSDKAKAQQRGMLLFRTFILRLQGLDAYIRQSTKEKEYGYYQVIYQGETFNYRDLFARADAFETLPIIPEIDGFLGESTNKVRQTKTFVSGIKLKLNGAVQVHGGAGKSVFDYNSILLDPSSSAYKGRENGARSRRNFQEKVLKVALLYCFVFMEMDNNDFRAGTYFEEHLLPALREGTEEQKVAVLQQLQNAIHTPAVRQNIQILRDLLVDFLIQSSVGPSRYEDTLVLSLDKNIMIKDVNQMIMNNIFFQETFDSKNSKNALKYVTVKDDSPDNETICTLPLTMVFEPIYYYPADETPGTFIMAYDTEGIHVLPTFLAPVDEGKGYTAKYAGTYQDIKRIALYYRHRPTIHSDSAQAFMYRFTYTLVAYVFLKLLADSVSTVEPRKLFCPILCIHAESQEPDEKNEKYDDEAFMHSLSKVLSHMLAEDFTSSSQGFYLDTILGRGNDRYKLGNALYSLYSALPHTFRLKAQESAILASSNPLEATAPVRRLDKLAIIVVSSRKCDENRKTPDYYKASILGKVIGIERRNDDLLRLSTLSTFSENQDNQVMYQRPDSLIEQVKSCFQQGYRHFLYVAKAPYTSTLHISDTGSEELFFMNKDVIQAMRDVDTSIRVYPVFCDKYYVINHKQPPQQPGKPNLKADSLYIDDIGELTNVANDPSKRSLIFFNLFSGIRVNPSAVYNGVMSYATLINVYENDPTYDRYIWSDILSESVPQSLKTGILDFLTLLHFVRYEKASSRLASAGKLSDLGFKLDPYTDIIGDTSVGKLAVFPTMNGTARFNALAFLTLVRAILHTTH